MGQQTIYNDYDQNQVKAILKKRKQKRRKRRRKALLVIFLLCAIIAFFVSDYSRLKTISVSGNTYISTTKIKAATNISLHHDYTFFMDEQKIAKTLCEMPLIKTAVVTKNLFGDVKIKITDATPIGQCNINGILYVIDETGNLYQDDDGSMVEYAKRTPQLNNFDNNRLGAFSKEYAKLPSVVINQISDINYAPLNADDTRCEFIMDDGKILYLRYEDMAKQLKGDNYALKMNEFPNYRYYDFVGKYVYVSN